MNCGNGFRDTMNIDNFCGRPIFPITYDDDETVNYMLQEHIQVYTTYNICNRRLYIA